MLNRVALVGRLTRDPELRRTGNGTAVTSFTLAVDRNFCSVLGNKSTERKSSAECTYDAAAYNDSAAQTKQQ